MSKHALPEGVWQSLPRQSDELRGIVEDMDAAAEVYTGGPNTLGWLRRCVGGWAERLSRIADKGECACTCDENCDSICPRHAVEIAEQYKDKCDSLEDSRPTPPAEVWALMETVSGVWLGEEVYLTKADAENRLEKVNTGPLKYNAVCISVCGIK
jgi:hypothetical protein